MNPELPKQRLPPYVYSALAVLVALFIVATVFQSFFPRSWGTALIALRYIVLPGCLVAFLFTWTERILFAALAVSWVLIELLLGTTFDAEDLKVFLSVLGCLPYLKAGMVLATSRQSRNVWHAIMLSVLLLNLLTLGIYIHTLLGGSLGDLVLAHSRREDEDPRFRFSFGNPIEVPAALALATATASIALGGRTAHVPYSLLVNLLGSLVSQSRMVMVISGYALIRMWQHFRRVARVAAVAMLVASAFSQFGEIRETWKETWDSIGARFGGEDSNSGKNRVDKFLLIRDNANLACLTIGNGINSSLRLSDASGLGYNSVEATLLQVFYEAGLLRLIAVALFIRYTIRKAGFRLRLRGEFVFGAAQMLLLLCVNSYTALYAFCLGALCVQFQRRDAPAMASGAKACSGGRLVQSSPGQRAPPLVAP